MGNTNSTEGNNLVASPQQTQRRRSSLSFSKPIQPSPSSSTTNIQHTPPTPIQPPQPQEPIPIIQHWSPKEPAIQEDHMTDSTKEIPIPIKEETQEPKVVPVSTGKKSGWVSSTGAASPWYGSLSSSTSSSHHRASISGPYYRTRGMSVTRDNENDEDLTTITPSLTTPPMQHTTQSKVTSPPSNQGKT